MLRYWNNLLNTDCTVVDIGPHTVYPIFRVGSSSLLGIADKKYTNEQIVKCKHIDILIRDPKDRFESGLNKYCQQNNLDVKETRELVDQGKLVDRHFAPQYTWLLHLYKYYKGTVTLKPFEDIKKITTVHRNNDNSIKVKNVAVAPQKSFVEVDYQLMDHYNKTIQLGELIKEYRHALS
jgi:hypothetical protein|tara:strand:+ start:63 stop:599 length:537 start_codon:yes stop_codon:yes gene_type:complete